MEEELAAKLEKQNAAVVKFTELLSATRNKTNLASDVVKMALGRSERAGPRHGHGV